MRLRKSDRAFAARVQTAIHEWESHVQQLPGLEAANARDCFIQHLVASDRSRRYIEHFRHSVKLTDRQCDPEDACFNPYAAAVLHHRDDDSDEALWLVFLLVHFGHHRVHKWGYLRSVYGRGGKGRWNWHSVAGGVSEFRSWLRDNQVSLRSYRSGGFGNHRKRESLSDACTGRAIESYVDWIAPDGNHETAFGRILGHSGSTMASKFDRLYHSMDAVYRFGRLGRFDYLTTASRLGLASIDAGSAYLAKSSGPLDGARLLFGNAAPRAIEDQATRFGARTKISFAVLEDALCNWQKSPRVFIRFRG